MKKLPLRLKSAIWQGSSLGVEVPAEQNPTLRFSTLDHEVKLKYRLAKPCYAASCLEGKLRVPLTEPVDVRLKAGLAKCLHKRGVLIICGHSW